jgi:7-alpha-hydroxysteroid dehydrogenase
MTASISGRTAIVTGAAAGIGQAIARHFLDEGANVVLADMSEKRLKSSCEDLGEEPNARLFTGDLRERLTVANLLSATIDAFERVDILINAARTFLTSDPLDPTDTSVDEALSQNLMVALRMSQAVARRMIQQDDAAESGGSRATAGAIVNFSATAAHRTQPELLGYSISTAAAEQMTRSLALALAPHRVRVNALAIGSVMSASLKDRIAEHPDYRDRIIRGTPLRRIGTAAEVAEAAQFLASDAAGFVTGQVLTLDGGRTLLDSVQTPAY